MGTKELLLSAGIPNEFGEAMRSENGIYKAATYEPFNKNKPYQAKKCSTPKPYKGHTYKHTIKPIRESREYEPYTYDHVYVMSRIYHEKPKKEGPEKTKKPPPSETENTSATSPVLAFSTIQCCGNHQAVKSVISRSTHIITGTQLFCVQLTGDILPVLLYVYFQNVLCAIFRFIASMISHIYKQCI